MGGCHRRLIAEYYSDDQYLNDPVVRFPNETSWQLTNQISGKPWEGTYEIEREELEHGEDWQPFEEHAVYECVQVQGPQLGTVAIMKVRFEVPEHLPPNHDPQERAKHASGMRLNFYTSAEIRTLERLTAAGCSATPTLLAVKVDTQDALNQPGLISPWWMPGGYIVYILMARIPAQSLDITSFWIFSQNERDEVRSAFRKAYTEVLRNGIIHKNAKLENLMWDKTNRKW
ncbi:MAG: hypothetical protein LQ345_004758 [Seirophora villosa]|nr:MAG: hypothetical protein LQ345_004758 [Seirophora villosa]